MSHQLITCIILPIPYHCLVFFITQFIVQRGEVYVFVYTFLLNEVKLLWGCPSFVSKALLFLQSYDVLSENICYSESNFLVTKNTEQALACI